MKRVRATGGVEKMVCPECGHERNPQLPPGGDFVAFPNRVEVFDFACANCQTLIKCKSIWVEQVGNPAVSGYWPLFAIELDEGLVEDAR